MSLTIDDHSSHFPGQAPEFVRLSKSRFVAGLQCLKRLYLQTYAPETALPDDPGQQQRFDQGQQVGQLAQAAFPEGVIVASNHLALNAALAETAALLDNPSVPAIFEAAFRFEGIVVRVDILQRQPGNTWRLIEVKSSTSCKPHYLYDIAIQRYVLSGCGLNVSSSCLMHLNRDYVYNGATHEVTKLFTVVDLSHEISALEEQVQQVLLAERQALSRAEPPVVAPGRQCLTPCRCEFFAVCNPPLSQNHINTLPHLSARKAAALAEANISLIPDIPPDFALSDLQRRVCSTVATGRPWFSENVSSELSSLEYPLYFMDFETIFPAIPRHAGMSPYSHIPFQWSVHRQQAPNAVVEHFEFLAGDKHDPRQDFFESLSQVIGETGHIITYNANFETKRLEDLAVWLPAHRHRIDKIKSRMWDLLPFVRRNVYHPDFAGSFSLKAVLPALLPNLTYEGMEVANGEDAGLAWEKMLDCSTADEEKARLKQALLAYCRQDTWALVALLNYLKICQASRDAGTRTDLQIGGTENKLVVAVASSALFDLRESDNVFRERNLEAYRSYQREHEDDLLPAGVAFPLIRRLLALNDKASNDCPVDVVLLSHNDADTGLRVFKSIQKYGLDITRAAFVGGRDPFQYLKAFNAMLFLSADASDVLEAIARNVPAGQVFPTNFIDDDSDDAIRIAFDFDGVLADDSAESVFQQGHLEGFLQSEVQNAAIPLPSGPLHPFFVQIAKLQKREMTRCRIRTAIITARNAPAHERVVTTLRSWGIQVDEAFFLGGMDKSRVLSEFKPHIFFDDQLTHITGAANVAPCAHVPFGVLNRNALSDAIRK